MFLQYDGGSFAKIVLLIIMRFDIAVHFFYSSTEVFIYCCVSREKQNLKKKFEKSRRWNFIQLASHSPIQLTTSNQLTSSKLVNLLLVLAKYRIHAWTSWPQNHNLFHQSILKSYSQSSPYDSSRMPFSLLARCKFRFVWVHSRRGSPVKDFYLVRVSEVKTALVKTLNLSAPKKL